MFTTSIALMLLAASPSAATLRPASLPPSAAQAITNARVNDPALAPAGAADMMPAVGVIGDRTLIVWFVRGAASTERLRASYSLDGGATFTDAGWLPAPPANWRWIADPRVETDPVTGTFFVAAQVTNDAQVKRGVGFLTATLNGTLAWGPSSIALETAYNATTFFTDQPAMKYDVTAGSLHLAFHDRYSNPESLLYRRSTDGGATWQPTQTILTGGTGSMGILPKLAYDYFGPIILYQNVTGWDQASLLSTRSFNPGTFDPPVTLASFRFDRGGLPGADDLVNGTSIAADRTYYRFEDKIYAAWIASCGFFAPPVPGGATLTETEPNNTPAQANAGGSGTGWFGGVLSSATDADCLSLTLQDHEHLVVRATTMTGTGVTPVLQIELVAPDGIHGYGRTGLDLANLASANARFTAPLAGTYTLRITGFNVSSYQISIARTTASGSPGFDRRDIYTSFSNDGGQSWSGASLLYSIGPGFDVADVQMIVGNDGRPYLFWIDFSEADPYGTVASLRTMRSSDGGLIWEAPRTLSTAFSDWQAIPTPVGGSKIGWRFGAATTPIVLGEAPQTRPAHAQGAQSLTPEERVCVAWPDARDGEGNIYSASFPTGFEVLHRTNDTTATAGEFLGLRMILQNRNTVFPLHLEPEPPFCNRNWQSIQYPLQMDPGQTISFWPVLVEVPDTAAAGDVTFLSAFNLGPDSFGMNTTIHVLPSTGAGARGASALAFSPPLPNPAASGVHFGFQMPEPARVALEIFDVSGARLRTLTSARLEAGPHSQDWNLRDDANRPVAAGVYLSRLTVGTWSKTRRVAVIR